MARQRTVYRNGRPSSTFDIEDEEDRDEDSMNVIQVKPHKRRKSGTAKRKTAAPKRTLRMRFRQLCADVWSETSHFIHVWIIYPVGGGSFLIVVGMAAMMYHQYQANLSQDRQTRLNNLITFADPGARLASPELGHHRKK